MIYFVILYRFVLYGHTIFIFCASPEKYKCRFKKSVRFFSKYWFLRSTEILITGAIKEPEVLRGTRSGIVKFSSQAVACASLVSLWRLTLVLLFQQRGWRDQTLCSFQDSHRFWICWALQPLRFLERLGPALQTHLSGPAQRLAECNPGLPGPRTAA